MKIEQLKKLFSYDPDSGLFVYLTRPNRRIVIGRVAGYLDKLGYCRIRINGTTYSAHRLAWMYMYGKFPSCDLDHINGKTNDNRIANLREVSKSENMQNRHGPQKNNKLRVLGVSRHQGKFRAEIQVRDRRLRISGFDTKEEAYEEYLKAKRKLHPASML